MLYDREVNGTHHMTPKTKTTLSHRRLSPVKYMKRGRKAVARTPEDMARIIRNAEIEKADKLAREASYFTSNF